MNSYLFEAATASENGRSHPKAGIALDAKAEAPTPSAPGTGCYLLFFLSGAWVRADAAAVLAAFEEFGFERTLPAALAAFLPVCSFFAIDIYLVKIGALRRLCSILASNCSTIKRYFKPERPAPGVEL